MRPTESDQTRAAMVPVRVSIATVIGSPSRVAGLNGQQPAVDVEVVLVLSPVEVQPLLEVSLVVIEPDADERDAEVRGALDVIAGENSEPARVDRQRLVESELGGEVGDRPRPEDARMARAPGVLRLEVLLQSGGRRS